MRHFIVAVALASCLVSAPAEGQSSPIALTLGAGGGWAGTTCRDCTATSENGPSGLVQLGVHVLPSLRLGVEWDGWSKAQFGERSRVDFVMAAADYYPISGAAVFLKGLAGYGHMRYRLWDPYSTQATTVEHGDVAYGLGAGYDLRVARRLSMSPYAQIVTTRAGSGRVGQFAVEKQVADMVQYGVLLRLR